MYIAYFQGVQPQPQGPELMAEGDIQLMLLMHCSGWSTTSSLWDEMAPGIRLNVSVWRTKAKKLHCGLLLSTVKAYIISSRVTFFDWVLAAPCD